ncbi:MAG: Crp/Fnr family transcriptional regulator [Deferribacteraceae bacterium]|jgi:CRP-like cAMP-binding protein|nr:Crp/Fnr family transcriptional regulator [Deferribacteraceae bacterium]
MKKIPVVPGIVPELPAEIKDIFFRHGVKQVVKKGFMSHDEFAEPVRMIMINSGCFFHGLVDKNSNKDIAISLLPRGRMVGFVNFFSRERMPSRSGALERSEIYVIPHKVMREIVNNDIKLLQIFSEYQERCNKSDMHMLWALNLPVDDRIKILFTSALLSFGYDFDRETLNDWVALPINLTRPAIAQFAYSSILSVNRVLAVWREEGVLKKRKKCVSLKTY